jgi:hypothetical protein
MLDLINHTPILLMSDPTNEIRTDRLILRRSRDQDLEPFAELNTDPEGSPLRRHVLYRLTCTSRS